MKADRDYDAVIVALAAIGSMSFEALKKNGYSIPKEISHDSKKSADQLNESRRKAAKQYIESELPENFSEYQKLKEALKKDNSFLYLRKNPHMFSSGNSEEFNAVLKVLDNKAEPKLTPKKPKPKM